MSTGRNTGNKTKCYFSPHINGFYNVYVFIHHCTRTLVDIAIWWLKINMTITFVCSDAVKVCEITVNKTFPRVPKDFYFSSYN